MFFFFDKNDEEADIYMTLERLIENWENEIVEFKEANEDYDKDKIGKYFSAISNEANLKGVQFGWLVFGVRNKDKKIIGSNYRDKKGLDTLKGEISQNSTGGISFIEIYEIYPIVDNEEKRVLLFQIPAAAVAIPTGWKDHYYGRNGESLGALSIEEQDRIRGQERKDWSKQTIPNATINCLNKDAIRIAKEKYKEKMNRPHISDEVNNMTDEEFLTKTKLIIDGKITNAALLLLGNEDYDYLFNSAPEASWRLYDSKDDVILLRGDISLTDKDEKVTLSLRDSDVEQVLRMFADIAGLNILFYEPITEKITLDIVDEPVNSAFELVMEMKELSYSIINGNTIVISKAGTDMGLTKQGITFVPVKYVDAASIAEFLNKNVFGLKKPGLSGTDIVSTHPVTNELMIFGSDNDVAIAKKVIEKFDKKPAYNTFVVNYTTPKEMADMICEMLLPTTINESSIGENVLPLSTGIKIVNGG
mgnify:CR=1 FL=1